MAILHPVVDFITFAFGPDFKAKLDAIDAARSAEPAPVAIEDEGPAWTWDAWTDADVWELGPGYEPEDATDHTPPSGPSWCDEAFKLGYDLGVDREDAADPDALTVEEMAAFRAGFAAGKAEWDRRLEEMCGSAEFADFSDRITDRDIYPAGAVS